MLHLHRHHTTPDIDLQQRWFRLARPGWAFAGHQSSGFQKLYLSQISASSLHIDKRIENLPDSMLDTLAGIPHNCACDLGGQAFQSIATQLHSKVLYGFCACAAVFCTSKPMCIWEKPWCMVPRMSNWTGLEICFRSIYLNQSIKKIYCLVSMPLARKEGIVPLLHGNPNSNGSDAFASLIAMSRCTSEVTE